MVSTKYSSTTRTFWKKLGRYCNSVRNTCKFSSQCTSDVLKNERQKKNIRIGHKLLIRPNFMKMWHKRIICTEVKLRFLGRYCAKGREGVMHIICVNAEAVIACERHVIWKLHWKGGVCVLLWSCMVTTVFEVNSIVQYLGPIVWCMAKLTMAQRRFQCRKKRKLRSKVGILLDKKVTKLYLSL